MYSTVAVAWAAAGDVTSALHVTRSACSTRTEEIKTWARKHNLRKNVRGWERSISVLAQGNATEGCRLASPGQFI